MPDDNPPPAGETRWFACHTKPRCEKKFADLLAALRWEHYLPLVEKTHRYEGRLRTFTSPLFNGYVFAKIPAEQKALLYQRQLVVRTLPVDDETIFLKQLDAIRALIAAGVELTIKPLLKKGVKVRVTQGPLLGVEATIENPEKDDGIIISMDVLQQGLHVAIPFDHLEILP